MSRDRRMSDIAQNGNEITSRLRFYFETQIMGPHKVKRLAQIFDCSPDMAKLLKRGEGWTLARMEQARKHFGPSFIDFVFGPLGGQQDVVTRLENKVDTLLASFTRGPFGDGGFRVAPYGPDAGNSVDDGGNGRS